jgi:hypothetical protein
MSDHRNCLGGLNNRKTENRIGLPDQGCRTGWDAGLCSGPTLSMRPGENGDL